MVFQCGCKHSCIANRLLWKTVGCQPHQSLFKSLRLIDVSLKAFKCEIVLFFEGQEVFISIELSCRRGQYPAIGTTSAASSAGGERGFFLMNIIKIKLLCRTARRFTHLQLTKYMKFYFRLRTDKTWKLDKLRHCSSKKQPVENLTSLWNFIMKIMAKENDMNDI